MRHGVIAALEFGPRQPIPWFERQYLPGRESVVREERLGVFLHACVFPAKCPKESTRDEPLNMTWATRIACNCIYRWAVLGSIVSNGPEVHTAREVCREMPRGSLCTVHLFTRRSKEIIMLDNFCLVPHHLDVAYGS